MSFLINPITAVVLENPVTAVAVTVGTVGGAILLPLALPVIGFGSLGPIAGSWAATAQATYYGGAVASGSIFAMMQSAGMAGVSTTVTATLGAAGAISGGLITNGMSG